VSDPVSARLNLCVRWNTGTVAVVVFFLAGENTMTGQIQMCFLNPPVLLKKNNTLGFA